MCLTRLKIRHIPILSKIKIYCLTLKISTKDLTFTLSTLLTRLQYVNADYYLSIFDHLISQLF